MVIFFNVVASLCCLFYREPIRFYNTTVTATLRLKRPEALKKISALCLANADSLRQALSYCAAHAIGAFRINSQILPVKTHPKAGYAIKDLPESKEIIRRFKACGCFAKEKNIPLYPFLLKDVAGVTKLNLADGIHPNEEGHKKSSEKNN